MNASKKTSNAKTNIANSVGLLAYGALILQWMWMGALYAEAVVGLSIWKSFARTQSSENNLPKLPIPELSPSIGVSIAVIAMLLILALTIYSIYVLSISVGKTGQKVTKSVAKSLTPIASRNHKLSVKKTRELEFRLSWLVKLVLAVIPVIFVLFSRLVDLPVSYDIAVIIGAAGAGLTMILFGFQYLAVYLLKIPRKDIW